MKMWKKLLIVAMALCLSAALCVVSIVSFAEETVTAGTITVITSDGDTKTLTDTVGDGVASLLAFDEEIGGSEETDGSEETGGSISYDADTATVVMTDVTATQINFAMNGEFTVQVDGTNTITNTGDYAFRVTSGSVIVTGSGNLNLTANKHGIYVDQGAYTQKGAIIDIDTTARYGIYTTKDITFAGGSVTIDLNDDFAICSTTGSIIVSGGTVEVTGGANLVVPQAGAFKMTSGSMTLNGTHELVRALKGSLSIEGGVLKANGAYNLMLTATGVPVTISGGDITLEATLASKPGINSGGDISISQATDAIPTEVHVTAAGDAFRINVKATNFYHTGGVVTGSGANFLWSKATTCTLNIGVDAELDFTTTGAFLTNAVPTINIADGVTFEEGKELSATATHVKSLSSQYIYIDTVEELRKIGSDEAYPASGSYRLNADLDLKDIDWSPLPAFTGTFDGRGHVISNLHRGSATAAYTSYSSAFNWGFFASLSGTVKNLAFKDVCVNISTSVTGDSAVGVVAAGINAGALVDNVAILSGTINVKVKHHIGAAGIIGATGNSTVGWTIQNCYNAADITATSTYQKDGSWAMAAGMIARGGTSSGNYIKNCLNLGNIKVCETGSGTNAYYSLVGNMACRQNSKNTTTATPIAYTNAYAATGLLSFEGSPAGIMQNDVNKTTLVDPFGAINPANFSGLTNGSTSKWTVKPSEDGVYYYPMLKSFAAYSKAVEIDEEDIIAKANELLDSLVVSNALTVNNVKALLVDIIPSADYSLTLVKSADLESDGSFDLVITLEGGTQLQRTLVIDRLPAVTGMDYAFDLDVVNIGQGTITVTLEQDFVAAKYNLEAHWGNETGLLEGYSALVIETKFVANGNVLTFKTPERLFIPTEATRVYVTIDGIIAGSYEIPASRKATLSALKYSYGLTSDSHHKGAVANTLTFNKVLGLMEDLGSSFMVVTGDFSGNGLATHYSTFNQQYKANGFTIPVFTCTGNHDALEWNLAGGLTSEQAVQNMYDGLETYAKEDYTEDRNGNKYKVTVSEANPLFDYTVEFNDELFIYLGIGAYKSESSDRRTDFHLKLDQLEWLDQVLADWYNTSDNYGNVYLMFHFATIESGTWGKRTAWTGGCYSVRMYGSMPEWNTSQMLDDILAKYPNLIHFYGHNHTPFRNYNTISTTRYLRLLDDSTGTSYYEAVNEPLGYTSINGPSSLSSQGFHVSVYDNGVLITGYDASTGDIQAQATFFIPNELNDEFRVRVNDGYIQYVQGYGAWQNLADVTKLSDNEIEVQLSETHVQYREVGAEEWIDLIAISEVDGEMVFDVDVTLSATVNGKDAEVQLIDNNGNVIETVTSVNGTATFTTLKLEDGVYTYTVKQNATNGGGWRYDATVYTITVSVADGVATIDGEAVFTNTDRVPFADGKIIDGKYVVTATGEATEMGLIKIGNDYYYVGPNGVLVTNQDYYAWQLNAVCDKAKGWYTFDKEGKMVQNGLYNGRYYVNAIPTEVGLFYNEADGKYYCAGPNGKIVKDADYYVWMIDASAQDFAYNWYRFDETGALYQGVADNKYYVDGRPCEIGLFQGEDDKFYCAGPGGKLVTGREYYVWMIDDSAKDSFACNWYRFDENGALYQGIYNGYYYVNGKPTDAGLIKIGDDYYFANAGGKIVAKGEENEYGTSGSYYVWKIDDSAKDMKTGWYNFDENGKMILPLNGIQKIDGVLYYYEDGKPADIGLFKYEGSYYFANAGGKLVAAGVENEYDSTGSYYVWKIHESAQGEIPTGWYNFDTEGKLIID